MAIPSSLDRDRHRPVSFGMAILKIARMGHPILLQTAAPVPDPAAPAIQRLIADMIETMDDASGAGLAAPQVHVALRVFVYRLSAGRPGITVDQNPRAIINPVVTPIGDDIVVSWEGCLSIPGLRAAVPRHARIRLVGLDGAGAPVDIEAEGFHATVIQHETDHLDGILYPMRMTDHRLFGYNEEIARYGSPLSEISDVPP